MTIRSETRFADEANCHPRFLRRSRVSKSRKKKGGGGREIGIEAIYLGIGLAVADSRGNDRGGGGGTLINEVVNNGNVSTENSAGSVSRRREGEVI